MIRKNIASLIVLALIFMVSACRGEEYYGHDYEIVKRINKVDAFPDLPGNYAYFDYQRLAVDLDALVFSFAGEEKAQLPGYIPDNQDTWHPIGFWIDQERQPTEYNPLVTGYLKRSFGLPTYLADNRVVSSGTEAMTTIAMVLGSSYAGIDKSRQEYNGKVYNFAEMTLSNYDTGSRLVHNKGAQGQSFWYDIFPQILFARLYYMYPDIPYMKEMVINGADEWLEALPHFKIDGKVSYEFVGYNVVLEAPTIDGHHIEPPNGGLAFLFYSAYEITGEEKYLAGAKEALDYLQTYQKNPNYEALTDYAPYVAAALNARYGTAYDVGKFLDFLFETDSAFRPGWAVMSGKFGDHAVDGLVGRSGDYAFSMNTFHLASVLAPLAKYDPRYATAIGKYLLNVVNNAKVFFPQTHPLSKQTMNNYLHFDRRGSLAYEGFRNHYNGVWGYAMGDATTMFGQPCDLSLYSSAFIGALGGIVRPTNVEGILQIDLNKTDSFGKNDRPHYLFYNPHGERKTVHFSAPGKYDLYDIVNKKTVARNVSGTVNVSVPAKGAITLVILPAKSRIKIDGANVIANGETIARFRAAVNFIDLPSRKELTENDKIQIEYFAPKNDRVINMKIFFNEIMAYDGDPLTEFNYNKLLLPDTDYTMRVEIVTASGLTDYVTKRVVCR
jgi:hypothetical protein